MSVQQRLDVQVVGLGDQTILFAHGFGCDQSMWRSVAPAFEQDYQVVLFDYVGHGSSDASQFSAERYATLDGYATDVIDLCEELGLRDVIFVGHCVSCMIGALAAHRQPGLFARLIFLGPSPCYINEPGYVGGFTREDIAGSLELLDTNHPGWSHTMAPIFMGNRDRPDLAEELEASFCRTDPEIARHFARVTFLSDNRADLGKIRIPCLILQGADDRIAPLAVGEYVHRHVEGSRMTVLRATGHCPHVSAPEEIIAAIQAFLKT